MINVVHYCKIHIPLSWTQFSTPLSGVLLNALDLIATYAERVYKCVNTEYVNMYKFNPLEPTNCPYFLIYRVSLLATSVMKKELARLGSGQIKPAYLIAMIYLWNEIDEGDNSEGTGLRLNELANNTGLGPSTITSLIDRMERDGLLRRQNDPFDRRAKLVCLTDSGRELKQSVLNAIDRTIGKILKDIPDADIEKNKEFLGQVLLNLQKESEL